MSASTDKPRAARRIRRIRNELYEIGNRLRPLLDRRDVLSERLAKEIAIHNAESA